MPMASKRHLPMDEKPRFAGADTTIADVDG